MISLRIKGIAVLISLLAVVFVLSALSGLVVRFLRRGKAAVATISLIPEVISWRIVVSILSLIAITTTGFRSPVTAALLFVGVAVFALLTKRVLLPATDSPHLANLAVVVLTTSGAALLCTSAFFSWPVDLPQLFRPLLGGISAAAPPNSGKTLSFSDTTVAFSDIANVLRPDTSGGRASLSLNGSTLVFDPGVDEASLVVSRLELDRGGKILTNGRPITIHADQLISNGGSIISFDSNPPKAAPGRSGSEGKNGGRVTLDVSSLDGLSLRVDLHGQNGGEGGDGLPGLPGAPGRRGDNAADGFLDCRRGGSDGFSGQAGGSGGPGGPGGKGGDGGLLLLRGGITHRLNQILLSAEEGEPGKGGIGGPGGAGGLAGDGGSGSTFCSGGHAGAPGPTGNPGLGGAAGVAGNPGPPTPQVIM